MRIGYAISVALNAVLIVAVVAVWRSSRTPGTNLSSGSVSSMAAAARPSSTKPAVAQPVQPVEIGGDWRTWIEPLRKASVPADVLAGLVRADFDRRWQSRQSEIQEKYMRGEIDADELAVASLEREEALDREMQAALGPDAYRTWDMARVLQGLNVNRVGLTDAEGSAVYELERGLQSELRQAEAEKLRGTIDQATLTERQQRAQQTVAEKLRTLLGEQRASRLQGADDSLGNVRRSLQDVPVSDDQIVALAERQRHWDETRSELVTRQVNTGDPAVGDMLRVQEQSWEHQGEQILGASGFDRYLKAQDERYAELQRNATRWGLPAADVDRVFVTIKNFEDSVAEYGRDAQARDVDVAVIGQAVQRIAQANKKTLATEWGATVAEHLRQNGITPVPVISR